MTRKIGVCSWSLRAGTPEVLAERVEACGLDALQLALDPVRTGAWPLGSLVDVLARESITTLSGMMAMEGEDYSSLESIRATGGVRPDETWEANRAAATENARLARTLGLDLVTLHAGFLPEERGAERSKLVVRVRELVDRFAEQDVDVAFETGQECAETLLEFLGELERPRAGVNFDPANMILYDQGDPIEALRLLAPHVRQLHVKDARRTARPGEWGEEVVVGTGEVDWPAFFETLASAAIRGDLVIEREAGGERLEDVRAARRVIEELNREP